MITDQIFAAYLLDFYKIGEPMIRAICNCDVPSRIVLERENSVPIMDEEQKKELIKYGKELFPDGDEEKWWKVAKVTHIIGMSI